MKNLLIIAILLFGALNINGVSPKENTIINYYSEFSEGWKDGYCEGWKDVRGVYAVCPIAPIAPIPQAGRNTYRDGYNRGFKQGMRDAY